MTNEELIREEASQFSFEYIEYYANDKNGHKAFAEKLKDELALYYDPEAKMFFLDQVKTNIISYQEQHFENCFENDCAKYRIVPKMLFFLQQEIDELPKILKSNKLSNVKERKKVFISYAHKDRPFLDELKKHFKPLRDQVLFWEDSQIRPGQKWKDQIQASIQEAKIAILLISADFFASDFIESNELPPLLKKAEEEGALILLVILKPCLFEEYPNLNQYQTINSPNRPLSSLDENSREFMWVELVRQVKQEINRGNADEG